MTFTSPRLLVLVLLLGVVPWASGGSLAVGSTIPEIALKDGTLLRQLTVISVRPGYVMAKWEGGRGSIALAMFPSDLRAALAALAPQVPTASNHAQEPAGSAAARESARTDGELPADIVLTNGFTMRNCAVARWHEDGIDVHFVGGTAPIKFANITPSQRAMFLARRDTGLREQQHVDAVGAVQQQAFDLVNEAERTRQVQSQAAAEELAENIHRAISNHLVVQGMTEEQVKESVGSPTRRRTRTIGSSTFVSWVYENHARLEGQYYIFWQVFFSEGIVIGQTDR